jgi:hypothetical protein
LTGAAALKENGRNQEARPSFNREASRLRDVGPEGPVPP